MSTAADDLLKAHDELARVAGATVMGELVAAIAHDINQPLGALISNAEFCIERIPLGATLAEQAECLEDILRDARKVAAVIARFRTLVERIEHQPERIRLNDVILDLAPLMRAEAARHSVEIGLDLDPEIPVVVVPRVLVQQVLLNLLRNGIEAMTEGKGDEGRVLEVRSRRSSGGDALVEIRDRGGSANVADLEQMFRPLFTTKPAGLGMGLAVSRRVVENHGGRIWGSRNPDGGMTFVFSFPANAN